LQALVIAPTSGPGRSYDAAPEQSRACSKKETMKNLAALGEEIAANPSAWDLDGPDQ